MSMRTVLNAFDRWRGAGMSMVMVTVYETLGSTYTKAGHRMLIADDGDYAGLVSGGCLEGDLAEHARRVLASGQAAPVTYDLRDEVDDVWGLGVGCNGVIRVLLQPLLPRLDYEPFAHLRGCLLGHEAVTVVTIVDAPQAPSTVGAVIAVPERGDAGLVGGHGGDVPSASIAACITCARTQGTGLHALGDGVRVLVDRLRPLPRLLVLGAGLDAVPLVRMAVELGWSVRVGDHRPAYLERGDLAVAQAVRLVDPRRLSGTFDAADFDAVIVMSHHLATDEHYLRQLAAAPLSYIGVLGPRARRERLLESLGSGAADLGARLKGPVGLDIGGGSPEAIALSVLAEMQLVLSGAGSA
jgi:xanthine/CO dehydrogenase XdhC/CoxF family maturation factor